MRRLRGILIRLKEDSLFRNSVYIMGTTASTSLLGFGFWVIVARAFPTEEVGRAAALTSAMLFVSVFTNLGLGQVFVSRLPSRQPGREWSLAVTTGIAATAVASLVGGLIAAVLLPTLIPALRGGLDPATFLLLPIGVVGAACSLVIDFAFIAERDAKHAFTRNTWAALLRIVLIAPATAAPGSGTAWILALWAVSFLAIDAVAIVRLLPTLGRGFVLALSGWRRELREMRGLIAGHQTINLGAQSSTFLLPVLVSAQLGTVDNAYFFTTFMVARAMFFIAPAIGNALFAEGVHHPERLGVEVRRAIRHAVALAGPAAILLVVLGPTVLGFFGPEYAEEGDTLLLILVLAGCFDAVLQIALAVLRARHRLQAAVGATWAALVVGIGATWFLLPPLGLEGGGVGWAAGKLAGVTVAMLFLLRRRDAPVSGPVAGVERGAS